LLVLWALVSKENLSTAHPISITLNGSQNNKYIHGLSFSETVCTVFLSIQ
jgi:hypothetical protein